MLNMHRILRRQGGILFAVLDRRCVKRMGGWRGAIILGGYIRKGKRGRGGYRDTLCENSRKVGRGVLDHIPFCT